MYNNKTIKDLKQILEEHNCAIPNGAKKKDLVELVEAIMAKDEDFVTMQVPNADELFEDAFEEVETSEATLVTESSDDQLESTRAGIADWLSNNVFSQK